MTALLDANRIRIYTRESVEGEDIYELAPNVRQKIQQLATWERPAVTGPTSANPEEIISGWAQDDASGGLGIEDADEGVDLSRFRFGVIDARSPHHICCPPKKYVHAKPSWASGEAVPLGDIGTQFYMSWGSHATGFNEATDVYYTTDNNLGKTPVDEGTEFNGSLFVPCGSNGALKLTELTAATGTLTITAIPNTQIAPLVFGVWDNKLYCINIDGSMSYLTTTDVATTDWTIVQDKFLVNVVLDLGNVPHRLLTYYNRAGEPTLWCITNKGAYLWNPDEPRWIRATVEWGAHPDFGLDAEVFRGGEDLFVVGGGLDLVRYTAANVTVPLSGISKDQGVPSAYAGKIVSMCAERSSFYCLVEGLPGLFDEAWVEDQPQGSYFPQTTIPMWVGVWTGTAWMCLAEVTDTSATPTLIRLSTVVGGYRIWWGDSDGVSYSQRIPLDFYNPRAKIELGRDEFEEEGWIETIRYDANMVGWDKIASHLFVLMDYASNDATTGDPISYVEISYRTDAQQYALSDTESLSEPAYIPWKTVKSQGRTLCYFDDEEIDPYSGLPWREGLVFQWVQFRYRFVRGPVSTISPIMGSWALLHVRIPQDAASVTLQLITPAAELVDISRPSDSVLRLKAMQRYLGFLHIQIDNETFLRGKLAGVTEERWMGGNQMEGIINLIFVEIGASQNAHQAIA